MSCERRLRYFPLYSSTWLIFEVFDFSLFKCKLWTFAYDGLKLWILFETFRTLNWFANVGETGRMSSSTRLSVFLDSVRTLILCSYDAIVPLPKHSCLFYAFQIHYTLIMPTMFWLIVVRFLHTHTHTTLTVTPFHLSLLFVLLVLLNASTSASHTLHVSIDCFTFNHVTE